jgi:hypothetical protein
MVFRLRKAIGADVLETVGTSIPRLLSKLAEAGVSEAQPIPGPTRVPTK